MSIADATFLAMVRALPAALAGLGLAVLTARSGTPAWQIVRAALTLALFGVMALAAFRQRSNRWLGLLEATTGVAGTGAGAGVAFAWLAKDGVSLVALGGFAALTGGLALAVHGIGMLSFGIRRWPRAVLVASVSVVSLVAVFSGGVAVAATNVPPTSLDGRTPAAFGFAYDEITMVTTDGVELSGWYLPGNTGAAVVVLHGAGSTRTGALDQGAVMRRAGYGVLLLDARGHGRSGGRAMDFGWYGDRDIAAAIDFLAAQPGVDPSRIGLLGLSMGGEQAIGAMAADDRIAAVVAEGTTGRTAADKAWITDAYGVRGWLQRGIDALTFGVADLLTDAGPPRTLRSSAALAARPVLLIVAGDVPDESEAAEFIAGGSPGSVTIWEVTDAGHIGGLGADPAAWTQRVLDFFEGALAA